MKKTKKIVAVLVAALSVTMLFAADKRDLEGAVVLEEKVTNETGNNLKKTTGDAVTIVVNKDTSFKSGDAVKAPSCKVVEFKGEKALKIRANYNNEIRCAFVFDEPLSAEGFTKLHFKIAGPFTGDGGAYNIGLLYTEAKGSGERIGSFYSSHITDDDWTTVDIDLKADELWGNNFTADKKIYCLQFWAGGQKFIYVKDLELTK